MRARSILIRSRVILIALAILLASGLRVAAQQPQLPQPTESEVTVTTMPGMPSLVPTLVAVGWENFFLDLYKSLPLSDEQAHRLYQIRQRYLASERTLLQQLERAQLGLYDHLKSDIVSSTQLQTDLERTAEPKSAISAAHFAAVLLAINVLSHQQHLAAETLLKFRLEMSLQEAPQGSSPIGTRREALRHKSKPPRWPTELTLEPKPPRWPIKITPTQPLWPGWWISLRL